MSLSRNVAKISPSSSKLWLIGLWAAQLLLFVMFGMAGVMKTFLPPEALPPMGIAWATAAPFWLVKFVGVSELAGAIGVVLPALTCILPILTPLAALGFAVIQILAIGLHAMRGETAGTIGLNLVLLGLSLFVLWGRTRKLPVQPRN